MIATIPVIIFKGIDFEKYEAHSKAITKTNAKKSIQIPVTSGIKTIVRGPLKNVIDVITGVNKQTNGAIINIRSAKIQNKSFRSLNAMMNPLHFAINILLIVIRKKKWKVSENNN